MTGEAGRTNLASARADTTTDAYAAFVLRVIRALRARGCAEYGDIDALRAFGEIVREVDACTHDVVTTLRSYPSACSWDDIGAALGITRQSAQRRFRKSGGVRRAGGQPGAWR